MNNKLLLLTLHSPLLTIAAQAAISGAADVEVFYYYRSV